MLRIQRAANGKIVFSLSGRIDPEDIDELRRVFGLESSTLQIALNLMELVLVNGEGVEFLAGCEAAGMALENCPAYVRKWIDQQRSQSK
jgi:sugar/nucleoside kinase (ribokinase family)